MLNPRGRPQADSSDCRVVPRIKTAYGNNEEDPEQRCCTASYLTTSGAPTLCSEDHQAQAALLFPQYSVLAISGTAASKSSTKKHFLPGDRETDMSLTSFSDASIIRCYATGKAEPNQTRPGCAKAVALPQRVMCSACRKRKLLTY